MKDLTKGKPSVLILTFALPIFLANLLQLTYSLADTRIVGTFLGDSALAAVGATTTLSNLIVQFLMGMCNGFAIISAQCFGAKDMDRLRRSLGNSLVLGLLAAVVLTIGGLVFLQPILRFLNVPENLLHTATQYVSVIIAGLVVTLLYDVLSATLRAIGDTVTPLIVLAVSVVLNIGGDLLLIMVLHMGVLGAAVATVLSQLIAVVVCAVYLWKKYEILRIRVDDLKLQDAGMLRNMLSSGLSMGFMSSLVNIGTLTLQTSINKLGQNIIIAHTAARKISEIFMIMFSVFGQTMATYYGVLEMAAISYGYAVVSYVGQNLGAGKIDRIRRGILLATGYTCIWCTLNIVTAYTIGDWLVWLVTGSKNPEVIYNATLYLKVDTLFYYVTAVICIVRNSMQGLGERIVPLISSSLEMIGKIVIAATLVPMFGYPGVIAAEPIVWFIMIIPLLMKILRMPVWKQKNLKVS